MKDYADMDYHPLSEKVVNVLCKKTQSINPLFFRVLVAYHLSKVASMMRTTINTQDRGKLPVNMYAINLAPSGQGKGHSTNIIEDQVLNQFRERFTEETFKILSDRNLDSLALKRSQKKSTDYDTERTKVEKEFELAGNLLFSFDSGTPAAVKQMRHKLLMADAGSMNLEIDEIGSNLLSNVDVLNTFLELFDVGKVKQKLTKNTAENVRGEEIQGRTPTNMMLFGTPAKLLDGGRVEQELYEMLETGYARRCLFGYNKGESKKTEQTAEQIYDMLTSSNSEQVLHDISDQLGELADPMNFGLEIELSRDNAIELIKYRMHCEERASALDDHNEILKAEISHRYFKALKLAGTYAFIDGSFEVTQDHLYNAIKLVEDSGEAFKSILNRDRNYVKLAKYVASLNREITHVDLVEDLPFYKGSTAHKAELLRLATAWGYRNGIVIKKTYTDGIEFLKGESIDETNLDELILAVSEHPAYEYDHMKAPFSRLDELTQTAGLHWTNHAFVDRHRQEDNAIPGFNMVVLDVDGGVSKKTVELLLKDYTYHIYTTKRHTDEENRFRVILPLSHILKMKSDEYKEFMANICEWLPFEVDDGANQRSRKWLTHEGEWSSNEGNLLDAMMFIPSTTKNEERKQIIQDQQSLSNIERWFVDNTGKGNRSNQLIKYALLLVDSGFKYEEVLSKVLALNEKLPDRMKEEEILNTIMRSASNAIAKKEES